MAGNRIYAVHTHGKTRLAEASNKAQTINFVARDTITAEVATQKDLLGRTAADVENAGGDTLPLPLED